MSSWICKCGQINVKDICDCGMTQADGEEE